MPLTATTPEVMATVVLASMLRRRIVSWSSGLFTLSLGYLGVAAGRTCSSLCASCRHNGTFLQWLCAPRQRCAPCRHCDVFLRFERARKDQLAQQHRQTIVA
jgi:hypothetical protein